MTEKPTVCRAGAPNRWLPGWFVLSDSGRYDRRFSTWREAMDYALSLSVEVTA